MRQQRSDQRRPTRSTGPPRFVGVPTRPTPGVATARATGRGRSTTQPGGWLKHQIPVRTFADWDDARPGFLEIDLVAHCGEDGGGFFLHTLCAVDIATGWVELQPVWGKGHKRVRAALHEVRRRLPVRLCGVDTDNGSEFINRALFDYCRFERITFTRSRPYRKNDSAHVEQKNGAIVRALVGYDRYVSRAAYAQLAHVYRLLRLHTNFFQPVQRLVAKSRHGARVTRRYDRAQTPFQRLLAAGTLSPRRLENWQRLRREQAQQTRRRQDRLSAQARGGWVWASKQEKRSRARP